MKTKALSIALYTFYTCFSYAVDPVADFVSHASDPSMLARLRAGTVDPRDALFRFDVDLDKDGNKEILLSSSSEQVGRGLNKFRVYTQSDGKFVPVGDAVLPPTGFYLGPISEVNSYGAVTLSSGGGGTGEFVAYILKAGKLQVEKLGTLKRDGVTKDFEERGITLAAKYAVRISDAVRDQVDAVRLKQRLKMPDASTIMSKADVIPAEVLVAAFRAKKPD